jgi:hypothetical protein
LPVGFLYPTRWRKGCPDWNFDLLIERTQKLVEKLAYRLVSIRRNKWILIPKRLKGKVYSRFQKTNTSAESLTYNFEVRDSRSRHDCRHGGAFPAGANTIQCRCPFRGWLVSVLLRGMCRYRFDGNLENAIIQ